jgi:hypothetical protein
MQGLGNVRVPKIGIGGKVFRLGHTVRDHADDGRNRGATPPDPGYPTHLSRIDRYARELHRRTFNPR